MHDTSSDLWQKVLLDGHFVENHFTITVTFVSAVLHSEAPLIKSIVLLGEDEFIASQLLVKAEGDSVVSIQ